MELRHQSIKQSITKKGKDKGFYGCAKKGHDGATCIVLVRQRMEKGCGDRPLEVLGFFCTRLWCSFGHEDDLPWLLCVVVIGLQAGSCCSHCIVLYHM
jgi:hypothetical protein